METLKTFIEIGGFAAYLLVGLSVIAIAIVGERICFFLARRTKRAEEQGDHFLRQLEEFRCIHPQEASAIPGKGFICTGLRRMIPRQYELSSEDRLNIVLDEWIQQSENGLWLLRLGAAAAPLAGILGTVSGMMTAFGALSPTNPDPAAITSGIAEAMTTTYVGILLGLFCLVAHAFFRSQAEKITSALERNGRYLVSLMQRPAAVVSGNGRGRTEGLRDETQTRSARR